MTPQRLLVAVVFLLLHAAPACGDEADSVGGFPSSQRIETLSLEEQSGLCIANREDPRFVEAAAQLDCAHAGWAARERDGEDCQAELTSCLASKETEPPPSLEGASLCQVRAPIHCTDPLVTVGDVDACNLELWEAVKTLSCDSERTNAALPGTQNLLVKEELPACARLFDLCEDAYDVIVHL